MDHLSTNTNSIDRMDDILFTLEKLVMLAKQDGHSCYANLSIPVYHNLLLI